MASGSNETAEPPAYTQHASSTTAFVPNRSLQDTRALILANAQVIKPRKKDWDIDLVVARTKAPEPRSLQASLMGADTEEPTPTVEKHFAVLLHRAEQGTEIVVLIEGQPQDTIEGALEYVLEKTEVVLQQMLVTHGRRADGFCCTKCARSVRQSSGINVGL